MSDDQDGSVEFEFTIPPGLSDTDHFKVWIITPDDLQDNEFYGWLMDSWPDSDEMVCFLENPEAERPTCMTCAAFVDPERPPPRFIVLHHPDEFLCYCQCAVCAAETTTAEQLVMHLVAALEWLEDNYTQEYEEDDPRASAPLPGSTIH